MTFRRLLAQVAVVFFGCWIALVPDGPQLDYRAWVLGGLSVVGLTVWFGQRPPAGDWRRPGLSYGPLLLLMAALIGSWRSQQPAEAWAWATRTVLPAIVVYLAALGMAMRVPSLNRWWAWTACVGGGLAAVVGLLEGVFHRNLLYEGWVPNQFYEMYRSMGRVMSTQTHPSVFGFLLAACLPLAIAAAQSSQRAAPRRLAVAGALLMVLALPLTFARGCVLAALLGVVAYGWLTQRRRLIAAAIGAVIALIAICSLLPRTPMSSRFHLQRLLTDDAYHYRWERVELTSRMVRDYPLFGVGLNHFRLRFAEYSQDHEWSVAENIHLMIAAEMGLVGFAGWAWFVGSLLVGGVWLIRRQRHPADRVVQVGLLAALVGMLVNGLTYDTLYWISSGSFFWVCAALLVTEIRRAQADVT